MEDAQHFPGQDKGLGQGKSQDDPEKCLQAALISGNHDGVTVAARSRCGDTFCALRGNFECCQKTGLAASCDKFGRKVPASLARVLNQFTAIIGT
jgi:hypothetical protein